MAFEFRLTRSRVFGRIQSVIGLSHIFPCKNKIGSGARSIIGLERLSIQEYLFQVPTIVMDGYIDLRVGEIALQSRRDDVYSRHGMRETARLWKEKL
jgi:hypothetical protein